MIRHDQGSRMPNNLQHYKDEAASILSNFFGNIAALGEMLRHADKDLLAWEYKELERYLLTYLTQSDLKAAVAVAEGTLAPELFPAGTRNSKILSLSEADQQRLLSGEKFQVYDNFGQPNSKTWSEMSPDERNRLLGRKGGRLHKLSEQDKPFGPGGTKKTTVFQNARYRDRTLHLNGSGRPQGEIELGILRASLTRDERTQLASDLLTEDDG
jgi:hypothetical protein